MKQLIIIIGLSLLASCGGGSKPTSPHGEDIPKETCPTKWEFNKELNQCQPIPVPPTTTPPPSDPPPPTPPVTTPPVTPETQVDSALQTIVNEYVSRSGNELPTELTYIKLTDEYDGTDIIGGCLTFTSGDKEIRIKRSYWDGQTTNAKKSLMFHELGHCIENLGHTGGAGNGECTVQTKDNTARVMDSCTEKYADAYALWYTSDWNNTTLYDGPYSYSDSSPWSIYYDLNGTVNDGYYNLYNAYTMSGMFADFFNE